MIGSRMKPHPQHDTPRSLCEAGMGLGLDLSLSGGGRNTFGVLSSDGTSYSVSRTTVLSSDGTSYSVVSTVLSSDGTSYSPI